MTDYLTASEKINKKIKLEGLRKKELEPVSLRTLEVPENLDDWELVVTSGGSRLILPKSANFESDTMQEFHPASVVVLEYLGQGQKVLINFAEYFSMSSFHPVLLQAGIEARSTISPAIAVLLSLYFEGAPSGTPDSVFSRLQEKWERGAEKDYDEIMEAVLKQNEKGASKLAGTTGQPLVGSDGDPLIKD